MNKTEQVQQLVSEINRLHQDYNDGGECFEFCNSLVRSVGTRKLQLENYISMQFKENQK